MKMKKRKKNWENCLHFPFFSFSLSLTPTFFFFFEKKKIYLKNEIGKIQSKLTRGSGRSGRSGRTGAVMSRSSFPTDSVFVCSLVSTSRFDLFLLFEVRRKHAGSNQPIWNENSESTRAGIGIGIEEEEEEEEEGKRGEREEEEEEEEEDYGTGSIQIERNSGRFR